LDGRRNEHTKRSFKDTVERDLYFVRVYMTGFCNSQPS
jgi:hypothetical protein